MINQDAPLDESSPSRAPQSIPQTLEAVHDRLGTIGIRVNEAHSHLSALRTLSHDNKKIHSDVASAEAEALVRQLESVQEEIETAIDLAVITASETEESFDTDDTDERVTSVEVPQMLWNTCYGGYRSCENDPR